MGHGAGNPAAAPSSTALVLALLPHSTQTAGPPHHLWEAVGTGQRTLEAKVSVNENDQ